MRFLPVGLAYALLAVTLRRGRPRVRRARLLCRTPCAARTVRARRWPGVRLHPIRSAANAGPAPPGPDGNSPASVCSRTAAEDATSAVISIAFYPAHAAAAQ